MKLFRTAADLPFLYYNCQRPDYVLDNLEIRVSKVSGERGVSMSTYRDMRSHGPFKIVFRNARWFAQFYECQYVRIGTKRYFETYKKAEKILGSYAWGVMKNPMFWNEFEWWSPKPVKFQPNDVTAVYFMKNAPCVVGKVTLNRMKRVFAQMPNYEEIEVNDIHYP